MGLWAFGNKTRLRIDREAVDETPWGEVDLTALGNQVAEAWRNGEITRAAIEEIYAYVEDEAFDKDADGKRKLLVTKLHGPHHVIKGGKIVLSRPGLFALAQRLHQAKWPAEAIGKAKAHVRRHYEQLDVEIPESLKATAAGGLVRVYKVKADNGEPVYMWVARTSNSFEDNAGTIIPQAALEWAVQAGDVLEMLWGHRGYLNLYHVQNAVVGYCTGQMVVGRFLLEWGYFFDSELARKAIEWMEREADVVGASIEFIYDGARMLGGTYPDAVLIVGRALCHRDRAENSYTGAALYTTEEGTMSTFEDLVAIVGEEEAKRLVGETVELTVKLENAGVECKTDDDVDGEKAEVAEGEKADEGAVAQADEGEKVNESEKANTAEGVTGTVDIDDLVSKAIADALVQVQNALQAEVGKFAEALATMRQELETVKAGLGPVGEALTKVAQELDAVKARQGEQDEMLANTRKAMSELEGTVQSAKLVFRPSEVEAMRPSRVDAKVGSEDLDVAELERLAKQVLDNNQAAVEYWRARRQRLGR